MSRKLSGILSAMVLLLGSCEYQMNEIHPVYAVPLVNSRLTVYDLLARDSSNLLTSQDGQVTLVYNRTLLELDNFKVLRLVNQSHPFDISYPGPDFIPLGDGQQTSFSGSLELNYVPATSEELYRIIYKAANLGVTINSNIRHNLEIELTFPDLTKDGQPFIYRRNLNYAGQAHSSTEQNFIGGYSLDLSRNGTSFNKLRINYSVRLTSDGPFNLTAGEKISFIIGLNAQNYEEVHAWIGKRNFTIINDSINIRLFQYTDEQRTQQTGSFALTDPKLTIRTENGFTIPFSVRINKLATRQKESGQEEAILTTAFQNPFMAEYPLVPGTPVVTEQVIDRDNSNIENLITPEEKLLVFSAEATANPGAKMVNKISRTSTFRMNAELSLPLAGYGSDWILTDTTELGFNASDKEFFQSAIIRLNLFNNFPIDADLQVYFLDDQYQVVDSLISNGKNFVLSGELDANGRVIAPTSTVVDIDVSPYKTDLLFASKYVAVTARLNTTDAANQREVRIFDDYFIDIKMGIKAGVTLQP